MKYCRKVVKSEALSGIEKLAIERHTRDKETDDRDFVAYFKQLADKRKASNHDNCLPAYHYLDAFTGGRLRFADLTPGWCEDLTSYLSASKSTRSEKANLSRNSAAAYFRKGVLGHDLEPNRFYNEVSQTAHELQKIGAKLVNLKIKNQVAVLYSRELEFGVGYMPFKNGNPYLDVVR